MPALVLFNRRWRIGSDDLVLPGFVDLLIRLAWLIAAVVIYWKNDSNLECSEGRYIKLYLYGVFSILHLSILSNIVLISFSIRGSIMDPQERKSVAPCLYIRIAIQIAEIGWNILGTIWAFRGFFNCSSAPEAFKLIEGLIICNWILVLLRLYHYKLTFDPLGRQEILLDRIGRDERVHKLWEARCKSICHLCSGGTSNLDVRNAFKELGRIFGTSFEDEDLVCSDYISGFFLMFLRDEQERVLRKAQYSQLTSIEEASLVPVTDKQPTNQKIPHFNPNLMNLNFSELPPIKSECIPEIKELNYFIKYALSAYTWPMALFGSSTVEWSWKRCFCSSYQRRSQFPFQVEGDNCLFCHTNSLMGIIKISPEDILHVFFQNKVFKSPFFVALDKPSKSILIAVRGSMSVVDLITDFNAWPTHIEGFPEDFKAHQGMLLTSLAVKERLDKDKILEKILAQYPDYKIVLTGTSLGAGVSTILGMLFHKKYPNLKVYAYSPPAGLLSLAASKYCEEFVQSIVYGDDLVCRMTFTSYERMKHNMIQTLSQCNEPKYRIMLGGFAYLCRFFNTSSNLDMDDQVDIADTKRNSLIPPDVENNNIIKNGRLKLRELRTKFVVDDMYMPGKILHIIEHPFLHYGNMASEYEPLTCGPRWKINWAQRSEFEDIIVSPRMLADHIPFRLSKSLKYFANGGSIT